MKPSHFSYHWWENNFFLLSMFWKRSNIQSYICPLFVSFTSFQTFRDVIGDHHVGEWGNEVNACESCGQCGSYGAALVFTTSSEWPPKHNQSLSSSVFAADISTLIQLQEAALSGREMFFCETQRHTYVSFFPSNSCSAGFPTTEGVGGCVSLTPHSLTPSQIISLACYGLFIVCKLTKCFLLLWIVFGCGHFCRFFLSIISLYNLCYFFHHSFSWLIHARTCSVASCSQLEQPWDFFFQFLSCQNICQPLSQRSFFKFEIKTRLCWFCNVYRCSSIASSILKAFAIETNHSGTLRPTECEPNPSLHKRIIIIANFKFMSVAH